jgi:lipopolysaccharide export system permease protein
MPHLLFITSNRIGDAVLSTAALEAARARLGAPTPSAEPAVEITVVCGPLAADLFRAAPGLKRVITMDKRHGRWSALWTQLRGQRYDLAVDLRGSLVTFGLSVRERIIHRKSPLVRHKLEELASLMGLAETPAPKLHLDAPARAAAAALTPEGPLLCLGAGANFIGKRWPPDRFALLARRLAGPEGPLAGARIALLGAPSDAGINGEILATLVAMGLPAIDCAGKIDLLGCAALLERATLFIGNDSGLMHMAACMGAPTIGLFGPSDERVYGPAGPRCLAIRGKAYEEIMAIGYMPLIEHSLMEDLQVDAVEQAAFALLASGGLR